MRLDDIPKCCIECMYIYQEWEEGLYTGVSECGLGIWFPTKKKSCKKYKKLDS